MDEPCRDPEVKYTQVCLLLFVMFLLRPIYTSHDNTLASSPQQGLASRSQALYMLYV